jgi:hypothetical protein
VIGTTAPGDREPLAAEVVGEVIVENSGADLK